MSFSGRLTSLALIASLSPLAAAAQELPNVVIVYADDLGYGDLSSYNPGAGYETPRLDQMAAEGVRFTDAHSPSTICSPSRAGLYAGQLICRTGRGSRAFEGPGGPSYLEPGMVSIADMARSAGYRTAVFGKWHVGLTWFDSEGKRLGGGFENSLKIDYEKSTPLLDGPNARGFDVSFVTPNCPTTDPLYLYLQDGMVVTPASVRHKRDRLPNPGGKWRWDNDEGWMAPGYRFVGADQLFLEKALTFIRSHREQRPDEPFFLVLSTQISHAPVLPSPEFAGTSGAGPRGDFVRELDQITGRLLDALAELEIDGDTLVMFNSDNGPETLHTRWMREDHEHDAAGGLRGMKRDGWEGGHRVPFIARWPGHIPAGQVSGQLTNTTDLFATVASIAGHELPAEVAVDSFDMLPTMLGLQDDADPIRPHMLTQSFRGQFQLRVGPWKYLDHAGSGGNDYSKGWMKEYALPGDTGEPPAGQLYHLGRDPDERTNLFDAEPEKRDELRALLARLTAREGGRTAPVSRTPIGMDVIREAALDGAESER
jgi:arylsulfatase A